MSKCGNCGAVATVQLDDQQGALICIACGAVEAEGELSTELDIGVYAGGTHEANGSGYQVVGCLGHAAGADGCWSASQRATLVRRRLAVLDVVRRVCRLVRVGAKSFIDMVLDLVARVTQHRFGEGRWVELLVAGCVHVVARQQNKPVSILDLAHATSSSVFVLGRVFQRLQAHLDLSFPISEPPLVVDRALGVLGVSGPRFVAVRELALRVVAVARHEWFSEGRRQGGLVAAALKLVLAVNAKHANQGDGDDGGGDGGGAVTVPSDVEVASACGVGVRVLTERFREIRRLLVRLGKELPWGHAIANHNVLDNAEDILTFLEELHASQERALSGPSPSPSLSPSPSPSFVSSPSPSLGPCLGWPGGEGGDLPVLSPPASLPCPQGSPSFPPSSPSSSSSSVAPPSPSPSPSSVVPLPSAEIPRGLLPDCPHSTPLCDACLARLPPCMLRASAEAVGVAHRYMAAKERVEAALAGHPVSSPPCHQAPPATKKGKTRARAGGLGKADLEMERLVLRGASLAEVLSGSGLAGVEGGRSRKGKRPREESDGESDDVDEYLRSPEEVEVMARVRRHTLGDAQEEAVTGARDDPQHRPNNDKKRRKQPKRRVRSVVSV